jgi:hypothetical protein
LPLAKPKGSTAFDLSLNFPKVSHPHSAVRGLIIRVSDQLSCGEISLFENDPEEAEAAKARLEAKRAKRRDRHAKNKDGINARRRAAYVPKKSTEPCTRIPNL